MCDAKVEERDEVEDRRSGIVSQKRKKSSLISLLGLQRISPVLVASSSYNTFVFSFCSTVQ